MKKRIILFIFLFLISISLYDAISKPYGYPNRSGGFGESNCQSCHGSSIGNPACLITVNAALVGLTPGGTYELAKTYQGYVDITYAGRTHWGLEVLIGKSSVGGPNYGDNAGTIVPTDPVTTQVRYTPHTPHIRRYLTHTSAIGDWQSPVIGNGHYRFNFTWVSPATPVGDVTFFWQGMATNSLDNSGGDCIGIGNYTYHAPF